MPDSGHPLGIRARASIDPRTASIAPDGTVSMATTSGATGYSIIQADDLASALELAAGCPHLGANGTVEVHEIHEMG